MRPLSQIVPGMSFGHWTVLALPRTLDGVRRVRCRCICGNERDVVLSSLLRGNTHSCGCRKGDVTATHRMTGKPLYNSWSNMVQRCTNPKHPSYPRYGGRGIRVCREWLEDCQAFVDWALANGFAEGKSIERIDNDKSYCPGNCRWATRREQQRNRHNNHWITFRG